MVDDFAEYIYGIKVRTREDGRVWEMTPQSERSERIVRCWDCKFSTSMGFQCEWFHGDYLTHAQVVPEGFCAWGEPREGDGE